MAAPDTASGASSAAIRGYHAHVNFGPESRAAALELRDEIASRFEVVLGRVWDEPVGPHVAPMYQVAFEPGEFARIVPWLMLNHRGLSIMIHPESGDVVADHRDNALWIGERLGVKVEALT